MSFHGSKHPLNTQKRPTFSFRIGWGAFVSPDLHQVDACGGWADCNECGCGEGGGSGDCNGDDALHGVILCLSGGSPGSQLTN